MNRKDFSNLMNNGYKVIHKNINSELRCFECGEVTGLKKTSKRKWKVKCINNHEYNLIDFVVLHTLMRDRVAKEFFENSYQFQDE